MFAPNRRHAIILINVDPIHWRIYHCVTTEKVPAKYRSLKMADASLGKWSIFNDCGGIASTRHWISVHRGKKSAWKRFRILVQSREALERLYEALEGPV